MTYEIWSKNTEIPPKSYSPGAMKSCVELWKRLRNLCAFIINMKNLENIISSTPNFFLEAFIPVTIFHFMCITFSISDVKRLLTLSDKQYTFCLYV